MLNRIRSYFRRNFGFTEIEIRGLLILTPLVLLIVFLPSAVKNIMDTSDIRSKEDSIKLMNWYRNSTAQVSAIPEEKMKKIPFFDPNYLTQKDWIELGFKKEVARRISNYRAKGGRFRSKEDVFKIYGINEQLVLSYQSHMIVANPKTLIGSTSNRDKKPASVKKKKTAFVKIDLNNGDTTAFKSIKGIGSYWSSRIVKYRDALGGFTDPSQLYELYGIEKDLASWVIQNSNLESAKPIQISINQDSIALMAKHPYISYKTARRILNYRKQHGDYTSVSQLNNIVSLSDSLVQKISPYLTVEK